MRTLRSSLGAGRALRSTLGPAWGLSTPVLVSLAAIGLCLLAGGAPGWAAAVPTFLAWLGLVAVAVRVHRLAGMPGLGRLAGHQVSTRLLLLVTVTIADVQDSPRDHVLAWGAAGLLLIATAVEPLILRLQPRKDVAHLPGVAPPAGVGLVSMVLPVAVMVLVLAAVLVYVDVGPLWWLLPPAVQGTFAVLAAAVGVRAYVGRGRRARQLGAALRLHAPEFVVYTARRTGGVYQLQMWLPYLEALGRPYLVVTRDPRAVQRLSALTEAPVVARTEWRDLDDVVVPSLRAAFYVNSVAGNLDFVTYRQLTHVYLGHGESDKALSFHPSHAMYDRIFVAGQAAIDRYARNGIAIPPEKFVVVGRPQAEHVLPAEKPIGGVAEPTILYAPTWGGYNAGSSHSSLPRGVAIVRALLRRPGPVIFRPHPFSRQRASERVLVEAVERLLEQDAQRTGRAHRWGAGAGASFADSANAADVMVADLSSVLTDFLPSAKPFAVVAMGSTVEAFRQQHPVAAAAYVVAPDLSNVEVALTDLLTTDPARGARAGVLAAYLGEPIEVGGQGGGGFRDAALRLLEAAPGPRVGLEQERRVER